MLRSREFFERVLERFPACELAVAYGSGVMKQAGSKNNKEPSSDPETALAFVLVAVLSFDICAFLPFDSSLENTDSK